MVQSESKKPSYGGGYYGYEYISYGGSIARVKAYTKLGEVIPEQESPDDEIKDWNFTNLVLFAKFQDEDEFIDTKYENTAVKEIINNSYNMSEYSVRDYMQYVSNDKVKMRTLFLYDKGGSLTLSKPRGYYAIKDDTNPNGFENGQQGSRMYELREDWKNALQKAIESGAKPSNMSGTKLFDLSDLDKNGDGRIDNITVIYKNTVQNISVRHGDPMWDYRDYWDAVELQEKGKTYTSGNFIQLTLYYKNSTGDRSVLYKGQDNLPIVDVAKIYHETLHVFGVKDLYRNASDSQVYFMSIMGKPIGPVGQFVSAKERESLGFLDAQQVQTINASGTYTLDVLTKGGGVMGYKMDIPSKGKTLYLEYRNFQGSANKYDSQNKDIYSFGFGKKHTGLALKSGLVCYLATTGIKFPSNVETSGNNWNYQVISNGQYNTKSDSAVGLNESLNIYGIEVTVNQIEENRLTFSISGVENVEGCQHEWSEPTYAWSGDNSQVTARRVCVRDSSHIDEETVGTIEDIVQPLTCSEKGKVKYRTARFYNSVFAQQEKIVETNYAEHEWGKLIAEVPATCNEVGRKAHYKCGECGRYFDENKQPTTWDKLLIPINPHAHVLEWIEEVSATQEIQERKVTIGVLVVANCSTRTAGK